MTWAENGQQHFLIRAKTSFFFLNCFAILISETSLVKYPS